MRVLGALALAVLTGCARAADGLPRIVYGRDACSGCGMILSEERFASGYVDAQGATVAFDDLGEFLAAVAKDPGLAARSFVHDAQGGGWLPASRAVFLKIPGLATPMGSGTAAFASQAQAEAFAGRLGVRPEGAAFTLAGRRPAI